MRRLGATLVSLISLAAAALTTPHRAAAAEVQLVAIGNNLGGPGELELRYAERDAVGFATVMQRLGDVSGERSVTLLGRDASAVRGALLKANARLRAATAADTTLVVYYSGHADARGLHLGDSTLPYDELKAIVEASPAAMRLLIVDSCRSGGVTRVKGLSAAESFSITAEDRVAAEGMAIITSSAAGEDSHESERLRGSFFTHHLVTALRGAGDKDGDGRVSLDEAYAYTYQQTLRSSGQTMQLQHPTYRFDMKGRGRMVLTRLTAGRRAARLRLDEPGTYLIIEGRQSGPVVAEPLVGAEGITLLLPPRRYFVQRRSKRAYREYEVTLHTGATVELSQEGYRVVAYARLLRKGGGEASAAHSLTLLGGARGELVEGQGVTAQLVLGYSLDLPWLTFGARLRLGVPSELAGDGPAVATQGELGFGLSAQRFVDLEGVSVGLGILAELGWLSQRFDTQGRAPTRVAWSGGFGALLTLQIDLLPELALQLEGGPLAYLFERAVIRAGAPTGSERVTPVTWWSAGGILWRF